MPGGSIHIVAGNAPRTPEAWFQFVRQEAAALLVIKFLCHLRIIYEDLPPIVES